MIFLPHHLFVHDVVFLNQILLSIVQQLWEPIMIIIPKLSYALDVVTHRFCTSRTGITVIGPGHIALLINPSCTLVLVTEQYLQQ